MSETRLNDYSLVGRDAALAIENRLAEATWFTPYVPREKMRELLQRKDGPAIRDTIIWFSLLITAGVWGYHWWGSWRASIPFAIYGVIYTSTPDSRWHESLHGTAVKTDWLNNALYKVASFMGLRESTPWRWSHMRHHSDTIIVGRDPEISVMRPPDPRKLVGKFFNLIALPKYVRNVFLHCFGKLNREERAYIPESEHAKVFFKGRIYVLIYASVFGLASYQRSLLPLMFVGLPNLYGAWLLPIYGYSQHAGLAENVLDHRLNSRTIYMNQINRFFYWNMNYHVEHHVFPLVPYHALPKLHELIKAELPTPYHGLLDACREIIPTVIRQMKDPSYHMKRVLPVSASQKRPSSGAEVISGEGRPVVDGWIEVGASNHMSVEVVVRFDHNQQTYAVYCTADGTSYATDGICMRDLGHEAATVHVGTGFEDDATMDGLIGAVLEASDREDFPLYIETHRAMVTQDIWRTIQLVKRFPEIRLNGDFSHYYTGHEMAYGGIEAKWRSMQPIFDRVRFMHGRIGNTGCMQVDVGDGISPVPQAFGRFDFVAHFRDMWTRAMAGFLASAEPGDYLVFAPEILPPAIYYVR